MADAQTCPVTSAHRRLQDVHDYWHTMASNYMDPELFRRALNSAVQELRNVSWLVQKQKHSLPHFESWYTEWQNGARADPIMRWITSSRNRIVKEGDLEILSKMTARYHLNWLAHAEVDVAIPACTPLIFAARSVLRDLGNPPFGLITITRRWVDYQLSGVELLDAVSHAYRSCAELLERAHAEAGAQDCPISLAVRDCPDDGGTPSCMIDIERFTQISLDASDGRLYGQRSIRQKVTVEGAEEAASRYGAQDMGLGQAPPPGDALEAVELYLEMGRRILAVDSDLVTMTVYFRDGLPIHMEGTKPADRHGKILWADRIRATALRLGATSVLVSADAWRASISNSDLDVRPVAERPDKRESLMIVAVASDGRARLRSLDYSRQEDGSAAFAEAQDEGVGLINYLEPLRKAWQVPCWREVSDAKAIPNESSSQ